MFVRVSTPVSILTLSAAAPKLEIICYVIPESITVIVVLENILTVPVHNLITTHYPLSTMPLKINVRVCGLVFGKFDILRDMHIYVTAPGWCKNMRNENNIENLLDCIERFQTNFTVLNVIVDNTHARRRNRPVNFIRGVWRRRLGRVVPSFRRDVFTLGRFLHHLLVLRFDKREEFESFFDIPIVSLSPHPNLLFRSKI